MSRRPIKPRDPHILRLDVVRTQQISPNFQRVTLGGADLDRFEAMGRDQWFRLFLPQDPATPPNLPSSPGVRWWPQVLRMHESERPYVRNYTVAAFRPDERELDVDFVLHDAPHDGQARDAGEVATAETGRASFIPSGSSVGVASDWASDATPGRPVGLLDQGVMWNPPADTAHVLVVADETGLPAVAGIARDLAPGTTGLIVVELPTLADARELGAPDGVEVRWVSREATDAAAGTLALATASAAPLPTTGVYGFVVGEQALVTGLRRALVARGVPKSHITFCGYWRR